LPTGRGALRSNAFRQGIAFAKEFGDKLNEIRVVTLKSQPEVEKLGKAYIQLAKDMKLTVVDIATASVELYRQGLNDNQVYDRLVQASQFAKVAAISTSEAVEIVTVAINTGMVDSAQRATDVLVALGDAAATDSPLAA